jgi:hypothetical protein
MERSSKLFSWYDGWQNEVFVCPYCKWTGKIDEMSKGYFQELFDAKCPKCWTNMAIVSYPSYRDTKDAAARGNPKAVADLAVWEERLACWRVRRERWEKEKLTDIAQLPDVPGDCLQAVMAVEEKVETWFVLKIGDMSIWRELGWYGSPARLRELEALLGAKYGDRFKELKMTPACAVVVYDLPD